MKEMKLSNEDQNAWNEMQNMIERQLDGDRRNNVEVDRGSNSSSNSGIDDVETLGMQM